MQAYSLPNPMDSIFDRAHTRHPQALLTAPLVYIKRNTDTDLPHPQPPRSY